MKHAYNRNYEDTKTIRTLHQQSKNKTAGSYRQGGGRIVPENIEIGFFAVLAMTHRTKILSSTGEFGSFFFCPFPAAIRNDENFINTAPDIVIKY